MTTTVAQAEIQARVTRAEWETIASKRFHLEARIAGRPIMVNVSMSENYGKMIDRATPAEREEMTRLAAEEKRAERAMAEARQAIDDARDAERRAEFIATWQAAQT